MSQDVMLYDKLTQQTQDMRANPTYSFTHNVSNMEDRFLLIISNKAISIDENDIEQEPMKIFASNEELVIESNGYTGPANLLVYDLSGRTLMNKTIEVTDGVEFRTQLMGLSNSIYMVEVTFDRRSMVVKINR